MAITIRLHKSPHTVAPFWEQTKRNVLFTVKIDCTALELASPRKDVEFRLFIEQNERVVLSQFGDTGTVTDSA